MISENVKKILEKLENYSTDVNVQYNMGMVLIPTSVPNCYVVPDSSVYKEQNGDEVTYTWRISAISIYPSEVKGFEMKVHDCGILRNITEAEKAVLKDAVNETRQKILDALTNHYMSII